MPCGVRLPESFTVSSGTPRPKLSSDKTLAPGVSSLSFPASHLCQKPSLPVPPRPQRRATSDLFIPTAGGPTSSTREYSLFWEFAKNRQNPASPKPHQECCWTKRLTGRERGCGLGKKILMISAPPAIMSVSVQSVQYQMSSSYIVMK